jgi:hypothetical protein
VNDRVPAHFYVGLTSEGVQQPDRYRRAERPTWPLPSPDGSPGEWLPRITGPISSFPGTGYVVYPGADVINVVDADTLWAVEPDWTSLSCDLSECRTRSARLLRRLDAFDASWKQQASIAEASRAHGLVVGAGTRPSEPALRLAATVIDAALADTERTGAARRLAELLARMSEGWDEKTVVSASRALTYAVGRAALATLEPASVGDAIDWARRAEGFAVGGKPVSGHSLVKWLLWNDLTEEAQEAVRGRERSTVQLLADELGLDILSDRLAEPAIGVPEAERLPQHRVPTVQELTAAAERYAVTHAANRARELCVAMFNWMLRADPGRAGSHIDAIVAGLTAEGITAEGQDLHAIVRTVLDEASSDEGPFEQLDGPTWRIPEGVPGDEWRLNPAYIAKAAAADGWDIVIPGSGYDYDDPRATPEEVIVLAGPDGPVEPVVRLRLADGSAINDDALVASFYFLADPSDPEAEYSQEISFDGDLEMSNSGFSLDLVLPERSWGFPDFREPTLGWVSCQGSQVVCAWARPGDELQGTWEATIEGLDDGPEHQRFWVTVAREIAPHA